MLYVYIAKIVSKLLAISKNCIIFASELIVKSFNQTLNNIQT